MPTGSIRLTGVNENPISEERVLPAALKYLKKNSGRSVRMMPPMARLLVCHSFCALVIPQTDRKVVMVTPAKSNT